MNQNLDKEYQNIFREIKEEKMNWDFEDFLKNTEEIASENKIIAIQKKSGGNNQKWYWLAASLVAIFGLALFFNSDFSETTVKPVIANAPKQNLNIENTIKAEPSVNQINNIANEEAYNEPNEASKINNPAKKIRKRFNKEHQNIAKIEITKSNISNENIEHSLDNYQADYVIVNGKKIYNEEEAINITKEAFNLLASNVTKTINQAEPIKNLSINF